ncbi:hypothetical protein [Mycoplasmopsis caviae]|nr:hypothetical protein [Mycoplasmopsis caviae]VDR42467.1 Uncharacterised protein [Mycoplasmopsis caviae]
MALKDAMSQSGLRPNLKNNKEMYKKYGFDRVIYGFEDNNINANEKFLKIDGVSSDNQDLFGYKKKFDYIVYGLEYSITQKVKNIQTIVGANKEEAFNKLNSNDSHFILDAFFSLLKHEYKIVKNIINILKKDNLIISKIKYEEILNKLFESYKKIYYANLLLTLNSNQSLKNNSRTIELIDDSDKNYNHNEYASHWKFAGETRILGALHSAE